MATLVEPSPYFDKGGMCKGAWDQYNDILSVAGSDKPGGNTPAAERLRQQGRSGVERLCPGGFEGDSTHIYGDD